MTEVTPEISLEEWLYRQVLIRLQKTRLMVGAELTWRGSSFQTLGEERKKWNSGDWKNSVPTVDNQLNYRICLQ